MAKSHPIRKDLATFWNNKVESSKPIRSDQFFQRIYPTLEDRYAKKFVRQKVRDFLTQMVGKKIAVSERIPGKNRRKMYRKLMNCPVPTEDLKVEEIYEEPKPHPKKEVEGELTDLQIGRGVITLIKDLERQLADWKGKHRELCQELKQVVEQKTEIERELQKVKSNQINRNKGGMSIDVKRYGYQFQKSSKEGVRG